jgi:hypothetical protein
MEDREFYLGRYEVLLQQIRDAISYNAEQTERVSIALEKIAGCINEEGQLKVSGKEYKYK